MSACLLTGSGLCSYWGDPHYTSFDGRKFDYQGVCKHLLVGLLPGQAAGSLSSFRVFGRNEYRYGYTTVSWFRDVEIVYGNDIVLLSKGASAVVKVRNTSGARTCLALPCWHVKARRIELGTGSGVRVRSSTVRSTTIGATIGETSIFATLG